MKTNIIQVAYLQQYNKVYTGCDSAQIESILVLKPYHNMYCVVLSCDRQESVLQSLKGSKIYAKSDFTAKLQISSNSKSNKRNLEDSINIGGQGWFRPFSICNTHGGAQCTRR